MTRQKKYLDYILNPFDILRTKKVLQVNPTVMPARKEPDEIKIIVYDYDNNKAECFTLQSVEETYRFLETASNTWVNIDGLRKDDIESICRHFGIHQLISEDILSIGQRPKMDDINGLLFSLL